mgnify:CR=1 FL=1
MQDFGVFAPYQPTVSAGSAGYLCNANGTDWYALCHSSLGFVGAWVLVVPESGLVVAAVANPDQFFPINLRVIFVPGADASAFHGKQFVADAFTDAPPLPPRVISRKQAALELLARSLLTEDEAVSLAAQGTLPGSWSEAFAAVEAGRRLAMRVALASVTYPYMDPDIRDALGLLLDASALDDFFIGAGGR